MEVGQSATIINNLMTDEEKETILTEEELQATEQEQTVFLGF